MAKNNRKTERLILLTDTWHMGCHIFELPTYMTDLSIVKVPGFLKTINLFADASAIVSTGFLISFGLLEFVMSLTPNIIKQENERCVDTKHYSRYILFYYRSWLELPCNLLFICENNVLVTDRYQFFYNFSIGLEYGIPRVANSGRQKSGTLNK